MKNKLNQFISSFYLLSQNVIIWLCMIFMGLTFFLCTIFTVYFVDGYSETPYYTAAMALPVLLLVLLVLCLFRLADHKDLLNRLNTQKCLLFLIIFTYLFSSFWIMISHSFPVADREHVSTAAAQFILGNWTAFEKGNYLFIYPYQLGYTYFLEICYRFAGTGYFMFPQMLNAVAVCITFYSLFKCTLLLFEDKKTADLALLLSFGAICAMFFTTYVYGNLMGLMFGCLAIWAFLSFLKQKKAVYGIASGILIAISCILKSNYLLFLSAMAIILILQFLRHKKMLYLMIMLVVLTVRPLFVWGLESYFEHRTGIAINEELPAISSAAMGLQDNWSAPGWHNGFDINSYRESDFNQAVTSQVARNSIQESLQRFIHDPAYAVNFFFTKTVSQWCEPTFQSIWESNCSNNHTMELSNIAQSIYVGKLNRLLVGVMDIFQSLLWGLSAWFFIRNRKTVPMEQLVFGLIILGGMAFQLIWEAKAQYTLQYLLLLIPYAAAGLKDFCCFSFRRK